MYGFDEEYEMEIDDLRGLKEVEALTDLKHQSALDRRTYFRELLRLQAELVKLQDWVVHTSYKLVFIFHVATQLEKAVQSKVSRNI